MSDRTFSLYVYVFFVDDNLLHSRMLLILGLFFRIYCRPLDFFLTLRYTIRNNIKGDVGKTSCIAFFFYRCPISVVSGSVSPVRIVGIRTSGREPARKGMLLLCSLGVGSISYKGVRLHPALSGQSHVFYFRRLVREATTS